MKATFRSTRLHACLDYLWASCMVIISFLLPLGAPAGKILLVCGISVIIYSLFTSYAGGMVNILSRPAHAALDLLTCTVLLVAPWFLGIGSGVILLSIGIVTLPVLVIGSKSFRGTRRRNLQEAGPPSA